jgi:transcriptional regulator with XRE-family HTH domain
MLGAFAMHPLEKYCRDREITQDELAKQLGYSASRLSQVINGAVPSAEFMLQVRELTGISADRQLDAVNGS